MRARAGQRAAPYVTITRLSCAGNPGSDDEQPRAKFVTFYEFLAKSLQSGVSFFCAVANCFGSIMILVVGLVAVLLAGDWRCSSQASSGADRPVSLRRDRGDWTRSLLCRIALSTCMAVLNVFLGSAFPIRHRYVKASNGSGDVGAQGHSFIVTTFCTAMPLSL